MSHIFLAYVTARLYSRTMSASIVLPSMGDDTAFAGLRPAQRVRLHLQILARQMDGEREHRLPATHQLAETLGVSPRTVATVYRKMADEGVVRSRVGDGTFLVNARRGRTAKEFRVGLSVNVHSDPRGGQRWTSDICGGILSAAGTMNPPVVVMPLPHAGPGNAGGKVNDGVNRGGSSGGGAVELSERTLAQLPNVDGLILFPNSESDRIRAACEAAGKPVVSLNPPTQTATADFISPDYYHASLKLGSAFRETGRRRVLYLISGPMEQSVSTRQRLAGLVAGLGRDLGERIGIRIVQADGPAQECGYATTRAYLAAGGPAPDAVYAAGDMLAIGAMRALKEHGLGVPDDVSVVGGTGIQPVEVSHLRLTCCRQPLHDMGVELLEMLIGRLRRPDTPAPGRYIPMPFIGTGTTREQEHVSLGI